MMDGVNDEALKEASRDRAFCACLGWQIQLMSYVTKSLSIPIPHSSVCLRENCAGRGMSHNASENRRNVHSAAGSAAVRTRGQRRDVCLDGDHKQPRFSYLPLIAHT